MYYILERGGEKIMKKRWFVVILTIGLLLHVLPLSVLALSPDPTITDSDGTILDWSDLSTVPYSLDDSQEQNSAVVDAKSGTDAETGSGKSLADVDHDDPADDTDGTGGTGDTGSTGSTGSTGGTGGTTPPEKSPADAGSDKAAADGPSAAKPTPQPPDKESDDDGSADDDDSPTTQAVCKIDKIDDTYYYSTLNDAITAAMPGEQIDLLKNIELDEGLTFDNKTLTISGGGTYTLTLKEYGIYAYESKLTFQDLRLNLYAKEHTYEHSAGATANLISNSDLHLKRVTCTISPEGNCGSGMYLYQQTNLYLDDSEVTVDAANGSMVDGIMADPSEYDNKPNREVILNNSRLIATGCSHAGLMLDPINITLNSSEVEVTDNAKNEYGFGLACYDGKVTLKSSTITATGNGGDSSSFGVFAGKLDVDGSSTLNASDNGGSGLGVGGKSWIRSGANVICDRNGYHDAGAGGGLHVFSWFSEDADGNYTIPEYVGDLTIESGATVSVCDNVGLSGIQNSWILTIEDGAHVTVDRNTKFGIFNSLDAQLTIEGGAYVSASENGIHGIFNREQGSKDLGKFVIERGATVLVNDNQGSGIRNLDTFTVEKGVDLEVEGNQDCGIFNNHDATLNLGSGTVRYNHAAYGGGLLNWGTAVLSDDVQLYNNHAANFGDDIYNIRNCSLTFGPTGRGWELDGGPDCYDFIDGWYDDRSSARWNAHGDDESARHIVLVQPGTELTGFLALKAAHGSTGSLTVCKETVGELLPSDYDTVFTFELTLDDDAITTINDKWCGVPFKNGKASFTLKSGESITLSNLPAGIGYTITETAQDGWTLLNFNPAETGVVPQNDTAKVVFTNLKNSPDDPDVPVVPVDPEEPEIPEEPEGPETPEEPEEPEIPEETEETEETEAPGELPAEEPAQTDTSASLAQPEETPTQNTTTVTLIQTGTTDWLAAVLLIFGIGLLVCGWFFDRKQRAAKH